MPLFATPRCCLLLLALVSGLAPVAAQTPAPGQGQTAAPAATLAAPTTPAAAAAAAPAPAATAPANPAAGSPARPTRNTRAAAAPAAPKPTCLVADFRTLALNTHDPIERGNKASEWLTKHSAACSPAQLAMINANRASWMGAADSVQLMGQMDGILEAKATSSPELMAALYGTKASPPRKSDTVTSASAQSTTPRPTVVGAVPPLPGGPPTALVVPGQPLPRGAVPMPVPLPAPGTVRPPGAPGVPGAPGTAGVPGAAGPGGAAAPNAPVPAAAVAAPAPAAPAPVLQKYFNTKVRDGVREFFAQSRGRDVCPPGTILREMRCEAIIAARKWKFGEPIAGDLNLKDVAPALLERLGAPPAGHRFVQVGVDVLLLADDGRVIDAVLDLGQVPPQLPTAQPARG